jgi:hypothetical protein
MVYFWTVYGRERRSDFWFGVYTHKKNIAHVWLVFVIEDQWQFVIHAHSTHILNVIDILNILR